MFVKNGSYEKNTEYEIQVTMTHYKHEKLTSTRSTYFETQAIPKGGYINREPPQGFVGDTFELALYDFTSDNPPLFFNVYNTMDEDGSEVGLIINQDGPVPIDEQFTYVATRTFPIYFEVFDQSGEILDITYTRRIKPSPNSFTDGSESLDPNDFDSDLDDSTQPAPSDDSANDETQPDSSQTNESTSSAEDS